LSGGLEAGWEDQLTALSALCDLMSRNGLAYLFF
jgi:hypothetical protein